MGAWLVKVGSYTERYEDGDTARARYDAKVEGQRTRGRGVVEIALLERVEDRWVTHERGPVRRESAAEAFLRIRRAAFELGAQEPLPFHGFRDANGRFASLED
jgi:hypothetical protein